jgi:hypothetical protein
LLLLRGSIQSDEIFFLVHILGAAEVLSLHPLVLHEEMPQLSAGAKHHILLEYSPYDRNHSFAALARRHNINGGGAVVRCWHSQWNGTVFSLRRKLGSGRPRILSRAQVQQHVAKPILAANRAHRAISYTQLLPQVRDRTGTNIALRTLQRYGKKEVRARWQHTIKRVMAERENNAVMISRRSCLLCLQCC